jgi:hypothetical protein
MGASHRTAGEISPAVLWHPQVKSSKKEAGGGSNPFDDLRHQRGHTVTSAIWGALSHFTDLYLSDGSKD